MQQYIEEKLDIQTRCTTRNIGIARITKAGRQKT